MSNSNNNKVFEEVKKNSKFIMPEIINKKPMNGYKEAEKIDSIINKLFKKYPMQNNKVPWMTFVRTVKSSLDIIDEKIKKHKPHLKRGKK